MKKLALPFLLLFSMCAHTTITGVPNLVQVRPHVWRGGHPTTSQAWAYLKSLDPKADWWVLSLHFPGEGSDEDAVKAGFTVISLPIEPRTDTGNIAKTILHRPDADTIHLIVDALRSIDQVPGRAWYIHCVHGQDRTGLVIAMLRVILDGWSPERAWQEMLDRGYHAGFIGLDLEWRSFVEGINQVKKVTQ